MNIAGRKYSWLNVLDKAFSVTSRSAAVPVLENVLVEERDSQARFVGSDGELTVVSFSDQLEFSGDGYMLLPPKVHDIVKLCPDAEIRIQLRNQYIIVECGSARWELSVTSDEYPAYPDPSAFGTDPLMIPKDKFQEALRRVSPAIVTDNVRPMFMFVELSGGKMRATDGSRLHQVDFAGFSELDVEALIPSRAINELSRRLKSISIDEIMYGETENQYLFGLGDTVLIAAKYVNEYPNVEGEMVSPALAHRHQIEVPLKAFRDVVKRVSLTADTETSYLGIGLSSESMLLSCMDKYGNVSREVIPVSWTGEDRTFGVNHRYLQDVLGVLSGDTAFLRFGPDSPPRLSSLSFLEDDFVGVLVQLRSDLQDITKSEYDRIRAEASP